MDRDTFYQTRLLRPPSNLALNAAREGAATASLGNLGQGLTTLTVKTFFLMSNLNLPSLSSKPSPLVLSLHVLVKSPSPALLQAPSGTGRLLYGLPRAFSSPGWTAPVPAGFPHSRGAPALWSFLWPPLDPLQQVQVSFLCCGLQSWMQDSRWGLTRADQRGRIPSLDLLATLLLMQLRMRLACWAVSTHCWAVLSFSSASTPKSFYSGLLSVLSWPRLYLCLGWGSQLLSLWLLILILKLSMQFKKPVVQFTRIQNTLRLSKASGSWILKILRALNR